MSVCDHSLTTGSGVVRSSFNPCFNGCRSAIAFAMLSPHHPEVSILVLMDVGLRWFFADYVNAMYHCFNPCFNGCRSAIVSISAMVIIEKSFNPCFNGCRSAICYLASVVSFCCVFQSLF